MRALGRASWSESAAAKGWCVHAAMRNSNAKDELSGRGKKGENFQSWPGPVFMQVQPIVRSVSHPGPNATTRLCGRYGKGKKLPPRQFVGGLYPAADLVRSSFLYRFIKEVMSSAGSTSSPLHRKMRLVNDGLVVAVSNLAMNVRLRLDAKPSSS